VAQLTLKDMTRTRRLKIGTNLVEFDTPGIGQILKAAGMEFVMIDQEYSGFGYASLKRILRYMQAADLPAIVRVPTLRPDHIGRALDLGAEGILCSPVTAEDCLQVLDCMKYAPQGHRTLSAGVAHDRYAYGSVVQKMRAANRRTTFFALIESGEAVDNVEAMAAIEGVDCLWPGPNDLAYALGVPGEFDHPKVRRAHRRVVAAAHAHGKSAARTAFDARSGIALHKQGFDLIAYSGDVWVLRQAMKDGADAIRAKCKGPARLAA